MVVVSVLPHPEIRRNEDREDASYFRLSWVDLLILYLVEPCAPQVITVPKLRFKYYGDKKQKFQVNDLLDPALRVVHTKAILFFKSMSERVGSDTERF